MSATIIAEAGVNHNGDIKIAKKLVDAASNANADYIKFQTFKAESLASINSKKSNYQRINTKNNESQYDMLKSLELDKDNHIELINFCLQRLI